MNSFAEVVRSRVGDTHEGLRFEGRSWTWAEVVEEAAVRAAILRTIEPGAGRSQVHVGVLLQNVPDYVFWLLGAALSGDVIIGINPTRRGAELVHDVEHVECDLVVSEPLYLGSADMPALPLAADRIHDVESADYAALLARFAGAELPEAIPAASALYLLLFSSGSTGAPKAVICSQGRLAALTPRLAERISVHRDSVNYLCLPLFHGHAVMMNLSTAAAVGATVAMVRKFSASRFAGDIREHGATFVNYVGRIMSYVLAQPEHPADGQSRLEVAFGTEASPAEVIAFQQRFGCEVREGYGATEGVLRITPVPGIPEALGRPALGVDAEVRDQANAECPRARFSPDGRLLNADEATGEIVVLGGAAAFEGYYKNPGATAERLKFDGNDFWSGDLAYRDEAGVFFFAGRPADWLRVDGENFGTAPIERILARYPGFSGFHAFGVADPRTGDQLMGVVTMRAGQRFDPEGFAAFADAQPDLGTKWRPTFVRVVEDTPTTANGKIDKAPLRKTAWDTEDVWWAPTRTSPYQPLTAAARAELRQAFVHSGRAHALPATSRALVDAHA